MGRTRSRAGTSAATGSRRPIAVIRHIRIKSRKRPLAPIGKLPGPTVSIEIGEGMHRSVYRVLLLTAGSALCVALASCTPSSRYRQRLLEATPVGTTFEQVLRYCNTSKLTCKSSHTAGYFNQETQKAIGVESIWAVVSDDALQSSVEAYWGFSPDHRLMDVWTRRTTDAP
jgi:hypothetical protein